MLTDVQEGQGETPCGPGWQLITDHILLPPRQSCRVLPVGTGALDEPSLLPFLWYGLVHSASVDRTPRSSQFSSGGMQMCLKYLLDITFLVKPFITPMSSQTSSISATSLRKINKRTARGWKRMKNLHLLPTCFHQNVPYRHALPPSADLNLFAWDRTEYLWLNSLLLPSLHPSPNVELATCNGLVRE